MSIRCKHIHESNLNRIGAVIWESENRLSPGHPTRVELYKMRIHLGRVIHMNRQDKDTPQDADVLDVYLDTADSEVPREK